MSSIEERLGIVLDSARLIPVSAVAPRSDDCCDAVEAAIGVRVQTPTAAKGVSRRAIDEIAYHRLGHINLDPHDAFAVDALEKSYVHPAGDAVNGSPESSAQFLEHLICEARRQQQLTSPGVNQKHLATPNEVTRMFVLHGPRGAGKTFFLNHLLARHNATLRERHVIWARLDLSRDVDDNFDVYSRAATKVVKLLFRYFDTDSSVAHQSSTSRFPLSAKLRLAIDQGSFDPRTRRALMKELDTLRFKFGQTVRNTPLTSSTVSELMREMCLREALAHGYALVAVLDNMDRLEATQRAECLFERLLRELREFMVTNPCGFAILCICRTSSVQEVLRQANPYKIPKEQVSEVVPAELSMIVRKRSEVIIDEAARIAAERKLDGFDSNACALWAAGFSLFAGQIDCEQIVRSLPNANRRAQMQAVQLRFLDYFERSGDGYHILELLTLANRSFPPMYYSYRAMEGGSWVRERFDPVPLDHRFVPSVFAYPRIPVDSKKDALRSEDAELLIGIRILHLLEAHRLMNGGIVDRDDGVLATDLIAVLACFGYSRACAVATIDEFVEFELVDRSGGILEFASREDRYHVTSLPKATALLTHLMYDIAYLSLAAMRLPLRRAAFEGAGLISAVGSSRGGEGRSLRAWVSAKIVNSISVTRVCREINQAHGDKYAAGVCDELPEHLRALALYAVTHCEMLSFHEWMEKSVRVQGRRALEGLPDDDAREGVRRRLADYEKRWAPARGV